MEETTGLENEFEYDAAELLDLIANGASGRDEDYPTRPGTGSDNIHTLDAEGNYINPNTPGADVVAGKYAEWLEEAEAYGVENLSARDQVLYAQAGFRSGKLTADEAQEIYDPAYAQSMEDFGYEYDEERGQWYDEGRLNDTFDGGEKGVKDWYTAIDFNKVDTGFEDFGGDYINSEWETDREIINTSFVSQNFQVGMAIGAALITGGAASAYFGTLGLGTIASGAASGALGSAVSGAVMGDITLEGIVTGAVMGGIGGWAETLGGMEGAIMDSSVLGATDDFVNATADMLGLSYDSALSLVEGVAKGVVSGAELEDIVLSAVGQWGADKTKEFLQGVYGDKVNVDDWFKDGQSNIPIEALDPFIEGAWNAALRGEGDMGDLAKMLWDYHREGGDLDFLLPPGVELEAGVLDWINAQLPDVDINFGEPEFDVSWAEGLGPEDGFEEDEKDKITVDIPGLPDVDFDLPEVPEVKCPTGERWSTDLSKCIPDVDLGITIPEVKCPTGERWSTDLSKCIPDVPDMGVPEVKCPTGERWSTDLSKCIPDVDVAVPEVKCPAGERWSTNLSKCIPDAPDVPDVPEVKCPAGERWSSNLSKCIPDGNDNDVDTPDVEKPDVDIDVPDLPDAPSGGGSGGFTPTWSGLFDYTDIDVYQGQKLEPYRQYIAKAKGMLS